MLLACGWQAPEVQQAGAGSPSVPHTEEAGPPSASRRGSCSPLAGPGISTSCSLQLRLPQDGHVASVDASTSAFSSPRAIYESLGQGSPKPSAPVHRTLWTPHPGHNRTMRPPRSRGPRWRPRPRAGVRAPGAGPSTGHALCIRPASARKTLLAAPPIPALSPEA